MKHSSALYLLLLILCATLWTGAQSTDATISGVVVDPSGKVIPGAGVEIVNDANGLRYSSQTNPEGIYTVTILPPGEYRIQVSKTGFKTLIKPDIILNVQSAVALNFTLPIGATSESVTIEAGASAINTTDGSVSTVIDRDFVENMPLNGRSFQDLLTLSPGVSQVANSAGSGNGVGYSNRNLKQPVAAGARTTCTAVNRRVVGSSPTRGSTLAARAEPEKSLPTQVTIR